MRIKQILAANPGWFAKFNEGAIFSRSPVAVWAIIEDDDGHHEVKAGVGCELGIDFLSDTVSNFEGIVYEPDRSRV